MKTSTIYIDYIKKIYFEWLEINPRWLLIKEIINFWFTVKNPYNLWFDLNDRDFNWKYLAAELIWYLSWDLSSKFIWEYASLWNKISNEKWEVNSNYWYLVFHKKDNQWINQYEYILETLINDNDSRQAIIRYNSDEHSYKWNKDFVCTLSNQFFIRNNKLYMIINMRSSDSIYWVPYDLSWFWLLLQSVLIDLNIKNLELWEIYWHNWSAHIYWNMFNKTELMINTINPIDYNFILKKSFKYFIENINFLKNEFLKCKTNEDYKDFLNIFFYIEKYGK